MPARKEKLAYISLGPGNRLYSEDHFLRALAGTGMTIKAFRALLKALSVPYIEVGRARFIDHTSLSLALRFVMRIGSPDFLVPACDSLRRARRPPNSITRLDPTQFQNHLSITISELLLAHHLNSPGNPLLKPTAVRKAAEEASRRMMLAGFQHLPLAEQDKFTRRALREFPLPTEYTPEQPP